MLSSDASLLISKDKDEKRRRTSCSPPRLSHLLSSALCLTFLRNNLRLLSCAASRFWLTTGFGRVGRAANLLTGLVGPGNEDHDADIGEDWISLRALASRADSGGGVVARMGLDDKGEEMAGRWAEGEDRLEGEWLAKPGKVGGRLIVVNMARGDKIGALRLRMWLNLVRAPASDHVAQVVMHPESLLMTRTFKC